MLKICGVAACAYVPLVTVGSALVDLRHNRRLKRLETSAWRVSVVIPCLNEEKAVGDTIRWLLKLSGPLAVHEIIVVDANSSDKTVECATEAGASQVIQGPRGRANQMNVGAEAASGEILVFLHADTQPPPKLVSHVKHELSNPRTVLMAFTLSIENPGKRLWFMSFHHFIKTYISGFRLLFGDQVMCCRKDDFHGVDGYNNQLAIMEDGDLCLKMNSSGPPKGSAAHALYQGRGRVKMLVGRGCVAATSGRRLSAWGNVYGTFVQFVIGLSWYLGASNERLRQLYTEMYTDKFR
eukprot:gene18214-24665_t